jgi:hypothetical protein
MELFIERVPHHATVYEVTKKIASDVLHSDPFLDRDDPASRLMNFKVSELWRLDLVMDLLCVSSR